MSLDDKAAENRRVPLAVQPQQKRPCDGCSACCVVTHVRETQSPAFEPCRHLTPPANGGRRGCGIYAFRPPVCEQFLCEWAMGNAPQWMKPSACGVMPGHALNQTAIHLTEVWPDAARSAQVQGFIQWAHGKKIPVVVTPHPPTGWKPGDPRPKHRLLLHTGEVREFEGNEVTATIVERRE